MPSQNYLSLDADKEIQRWQEPSGSATSYCACFPLQTHANRSSSLHARSCCGLHAALDHLQTPLASSLVSKHVWWLSTVTRLIMRGEWWAPIQKSFEGFLGQFWSHRVAKAASHQCALRFLKRCSHFLWGMFSKSINYIKSILKIIECEFLVNKALKGYWSLRQLKFDVKTLLKMIQTKQNH